MSCIAPVFVARLRAEIAAQVARPPIWVPLMTPTLLHAKVYRDEQLCSQIQPLLGERFTLDTVRVVHGAQTRPAHPPLFGAHPDAGAAFGVRVALNLHLDEPPARVADLREPLVLEDGLWLEWLFVRRWFVDTQTDPQLPALRANADDIAAIDDTLGTILERLTVQYNYDRPRRQRA